MAFTFGATAPAPAGGLFGAPAPAAPAAGSLFGSAPAAPAGGLFGTPAATTPATGGLFGGAPTATSAAAPTGGLFGATAAAPAAATSLFGGAAAPAPSLFGAAPACVHGHTFSGPALTPPLTSPRIARSVCQACWGAVRCTRTRARCRRWLIRRTRARSCGWWPIWCTGTGAYWWGSVWCHRARARRRRRSVRCNDDPRAVGRTLWRKPLWRRSWWGAGSGHSHPGRGINRHRCTRRCGDGWRGQWSTVDSSQHDVRAATAANSGMARQAGTHNFRGDPLHTPRTHLVHM